MYKHPSPRSTKRISSMGYPLQRCAAIPHTTVAERVIGFGDWHWCTLEVTPLLCGHTQALQRAAYHSYPSAVHVPPDGAGHPCNSLGTAHPAGAVARSDISGNWLARWKTQDRTRNHFWAAVPSVGREPAYASAAMSLRLAPFATSSSP